MTWRKIGRYLWTGLTACGFATYMYPPGGWPPAAAPHPERLVPHRLPDATEQALWDQLADLHQLR
jgi:hypothetical protein